MAKVTDLWPACHEFEPSTAEDPPCRGGVMHVKYVELHTFSRSAVEDLLQGGGRYTLNLSCLKRPPVGVKVRRGGAQLRYHPNHLNMVQNYEVSHQ
ncbi:hypothetical protein TNCV_980591 [Trichonephila clavipes]|uniref:Uncharacterized protein n=1 Tax=Trichonephila clavipes TaxID=2585209 RepID=A0A8X6VD42_TRICX|nr:hypothetical protein TNCV_980591 [Trichonephila clavipes]